MGSSLKGIVLDCEPLGIGRMLTFVPSSLALLSLEVSINRCLLEELIRL